VVKGERRRNLGAALTKDFVEKAGVAKEANRKEKGAFINRQGETVPKDV